MKVNNKGFTLIELVVVITIIGILAAVAAPRFINVQSDARESVLGGVEASMRSAASLIYAKALIASVETAASSSVTTDAGAVATVFGYPALAAITPLLTISSSDLVVVAADGEVGYDFDADGTIDDCKATYVVSTGANVPPDVTLTTADC